jgi:hypothetical protein
MKTCKEKIKKKKPLKKLFVELRNKIEEEGYFMQESKCSYTLDL